MGVRCQWILSSADSGVTSPMPSPPCQARAAHTYARAHTTASEQICFIQSEVRPVGRLGAGHTCHLPVTPRDP